MTAGYPGWHPPVTSALPREAYTPWITRVLATLIDGIAPLVLLAIGFGLLVGARQTECAPGTEYDVTDFCTTGASMLGLVGFWGALLVSLGYFLWNYGYRQGTCGASIGKSILRFRVVSESTSQPIGFVMATIRQIMHIVDAAICFVGFLVPLWDPKRQTLADKMTRTVCLPM
jgi:uncharacterized RDD family membrane protein YckC